MVADSSDDVLILHPAIIDLDITPPDIPVPGRSTTYVASAGAATLYLELYDSVSGEILARVVDRQRMAIMAISSGPIALSTAPRLSDCLRVAPICCDRG